MIGCVRDFFTYETTKSVVVKSSTIGIFNRVVQLLIIAYFVGWVFLHEKAYQVRDTSIESTVITKVKGLGLYNNRVMDVADYVTPAQGASMFCIITKLISTEDQIQSNCAESEVKKAKCTNNSNCTEGASAPNGIMTGRCVDFDNSSKTCEIRGWCPAEIDSLKIEPMMEVENFTIFIKNSIRFPLFNFTKGTLLPSITVDEIKNCNFNMSNIYCPIFRVGDILSFAHQDFYSIANEGGVIGVKINWVCDLDRSAEECKPAFSFTRLDAVSRSNTVSKGYNFRFAKYYKSQNGTEYRTLIKAFGIRFDIIVSGTARKFSVIPTLINVVAAFTTIGVGTVLCDIILLNFLKGGDKYKAIKFEEVSEVTDSLSNSNELYQGSSTQLSVQQLGKHSEDSGAYSIGQHG
ncbi:P2X purinoceptor 3a [Anguilla rostrata]|uniref:P2X purinoceptor 3a n=1 Tax=Anguilla rostrata TaxID=7938 RepID=UPI0030D5634E